MEVGRQAGYCRGCRQMVWLDERGGCPVPGHYSNFLSHVQEVEDGQLPSPPPRSEVKAAERARKAGANKGSSSASAGAKEGRSVKQLQAVLVMTPRPLNNAQQLLQQIIDEQKAMGHAAAPGFVATTRVGDVADQQYVYATIRTAFESFGGADVIDRTTVKTFQASDGNSGSYFLLFDRA